MANEQIGSLEKAIRQKAMIPAKDEFQRSINFVTRNIHNLDIPTTAAEKDTFWRIVKALEAKHIQRECDEAVRQFVSTYNNLVQQFPQLSEDIAAEAVYQNQAESGNG